MAWAAFAVAAVAVCARGLRLPWLLAFALPCAAAAFWGGLVPPPRPARALSAALAVALLPTLLLGWVLMAYPVLPPPLVRALSLACGTALCLLCAVLASLADGPWRDPRLAAAGLGAVAVGAFDPTAGVGLALWGVAVAALAWLAVGRLTPRRLPRLVAAVVVTGGVAEAITRVLPPAQDRVETVLAGLATGGTSGSSTHAKLGELEGMQLSREIVLRAWMPSARRLRVRVYSRFDGQNWHPGTGRLLPLEPSDATADGWPAELASVPGSTWRVPGAGAGERELVRVVAAGLGAGALAAPRGAALLRVPFEGVTVDDAGILLPPARERAATYAVAQALSPVRRPPDTQALASALTLPRDTDPRLRALAAALSTGLPDARARAHRVSAYVSTRARYVTDPGPFRTKQPVAEFLFEKRAGYCEYFASASVVLLRLMGVPARYVTGYAIQEWSRSGDHYVVRAADTHAWIEAYDEREGWIELDPTPAAEYDAVRLALAVGGVERALERLRGELARALAVLRAGDLTAFGALIRERPALLLPLLGSAPPLLVRAWRRRRRSSSAAAAAAPMSPAPPELRALRERVDAAFARLGVPRGVASGLVEHALALPARLPAEARAAGLRAAEACSAARFGNAPLPPAAAATEAFERLAGSAGSR